MAQAFVQPERMFDVDPAQLRNLWGVALKLIPGGSGLFIEIQRAPDSSGSPGTPVTIDTVGPFAEGGGVYVDPRPKDGALWWYRARHTGQTVDPGTYTSWVSAIAYSVRTDLVNAFAAGETYPLPRTAAVSGQVRTVYNSLTHLIPNGEFEVWEFDSQPYGIAVDTTGGAAAARVTGANVFSGDVALKYTNPDNASAGGWHGVSTNDPTKGAFCIPLRPGISYHLRIASKVSVLGAGQQYRVRFSFNGAESLTTSKAWTYKTVDTYQVDLFSFTVPVAAEANAKLYIEFNRNGSAASTDFHVDSVRLEEVAEPIFFDNGNVSGAVTIDWSKAPTQRIRLTGNVTSMAFINGRPGGRNVLDVQQDGTGSYTIVWPGTVTWGSDTAPTLTTTANKMDSFGFEFVGDVISQYRGHTISLNVTMYDVKTAVGSLEVTSSQVATTTIPVTGVGFTPKLILFFWNGRSDTADANGRADPRRGFGAASGTSARRCITGFSDDASAGLANGRQGRDDACVAEVSASQTDGRLDLQSFDADGFTMIVDVQFVNTHRIFFLAVGGNTVLAKVGTVNITAGTGNLGFTDPAFKPTGLLLFGNGLLSAEINTFVQPDQFNLGFGTSNTNRWTVGGTAHAGSDVAGSYGHDAEVFSNVRFDGAVVDITGRSNFISFDTNGFTLNRLETFGSLGPHTFYVALQGAKCVVFPITTRTDTTTDIVASGLALRPKALVMLSMAKTVLSQDQVQDNDEWSLGVVAENPAGGAPIQRAMGTIVKNGSGAEAGSAIAYNAAYVNMDTAAAMEGKMRVTSLEVDGFKARMDDADPSAAYVGVLAIGI
jgi:hypothetical protein